MDQLEVTDQAPRGPGRARIEATLDRLGLAQDETRAAILEGLASLDGPLVGRFLRRLDTIAQEDVHKIISGMRLDVIHGGEFVSAPARHLERVLAQHQHRIKAEWRALGAMAPADVPGLVPRVDASLDWMMKVGFGYMSAVPSADVRADRIPAARDAFLRVFAQVEPEIRGELLGKLDQLTPSQVGWMVLYPVMYGLEEDYQTARQPKAESLQDYAKMMRKELARSAAVVRFEDVSGYEPVGSNYRNKDYADPTLVEAALGIIHKRETSGGEFIGSHVRHAMEVLCASPVQSAAVDAALAQHALRGPANHRAGAVIGLFARGAASPPIEPLLAAAADKWRVGQVLAGLRDLLQEDKLDRIPPVALARISQTLQKNLVRVDEYTSRWVKFGQTETAELVQKLGLVGPLTAAEIQALYGDANATSTSA